MNDQNNKYGGGRSKLGFASVLTLIFITLKLLGKITWSWVWVLSPLWIALLLMIILCTVLTIIEMKNKK